MLQHSFKDINFGLFSEVNTHSFRSKRSLFNSVDLKQCYQTVGSAPNLSLELSERTGRWSRYGPCRVWPRIDQSSSMPRGLETCCLLSLETGQIIKGRTVRRMEKLWEEFCGKWSKDEVFEESMKGLLLIIWKRRIIIKFFWRWRKGELNFLSGRRRQDLK